MKSGYCEDRENYSRLLVTKRKRRITRRQRERRRGRGWGERVTMILLALPDVDDGEMGAPHRVLGVVEVEVGVVGVEVGVVLVREAAGVTTIKMC